MVCFGRLHLLIGDSRALGLFRPPTAREVLEFQVTHFAFLLEGLAVWPFRSLRAGDFLHFWEVALLNVVTIVRLGCSGRLVHERSSNVK